MMTRPRQHLTIILVITVASTSVLGYDFDANEYYDKLGEVAKRIKEMCGDVCETRNESRFVVARDPDEQQDMFPALEKQFDCRKLFQIQKTESLDIKPPQPPRKIPKSLLAEFTYHGRVPMKKDYMSNHGDSTSNRYVKYWTKEFIDGKIEEIRSGKMISGSYGPESTEEILQHLEKYMDVAGKHVLVIGSQSPWVEILLLYLGAKHVTTLEYNDVKNKHADITVINPMEMADKFLHTSSDTCDKTKLDCYFSRFDLMVSFSSLEHSGLGRYGDQLNPWGDRLEMARAHCLLKPGGRALVGVPVHKEDMLLFNSARVYGELQLSHLYANFRLIHFNRDYKKIKPGCDYCYQPVAIVEKKDV